MRGHILTRPFLLSERDTDQAVIHKGWLRRFDKMKFTTDMVCFRTKETRVFPNMYRWTHKLPPPVWPKAQLVVKGVKGPEEIVSGAHAGFDGSEESKALGGHLDFIKGRTNIFKSAMAAHL
ncbi:hypothetical protein PoB_003791100 [Plakobranchus ocellatus]|uniref:Uncharacterized protein n=1 Tax=Plakobranchus ocellatus TaxID=259542 RepID=A0AAV4ATF0_9GAST|nr:hypothetical protein PoB_003791100 [Plakobranchus ocellatus]